MGLTLGRGASATLPQALFGTSVVWDGTGAYVFGGHDGTSERDEIVRYDPPRRRRHEHAADAADGAAPHGRGVGRNEGARLGGYDNSYLDEIVHDAP